jgi:hypothetical protein
MDQAARFENTRPFPQRGNVRSVSGFALDLTFKLVPTGSGFHKFYSLLENRMKLQIIINYKTYKTYESLTPMLQIIKVRSIARSAFKRFSQSSSLIPFSSLSMDLRCFPFNRRSK